MYGSRRIGVFKFPTNDSEAQTFYELTDNIGNVRAVINSQRESEEVRVESFADYYSFGLLMPGQHANTQEYELDYQGQRKDAETGFNAFELRMFDARIGRWMAPDPYEQHWSPYLAMSNNPISSIDPDGGVDYNVESGAVTDEFYYNFVFNSLSGEEKEYGNILKYDPKLEWRMANNGDLSGFYKLGREMGYSMAEWDEQTGKPEWERVFSHWDTKEYPSGDKFSVMRYKMVSNPAYDAVRRKLSSQNNAENLSENKKLNNNQNNLDDRNLFKNTIAPSLGIVFGLMETSANQSKLKIIQQSKEIKKVTSTNRVLFNGFKKVEKFTGFAAKALGVYGAINSGIKLWNDPTNPANWLKFGANTGMLFMKANPLNFGISFGYTILDEGGYIDNFFNTNDKNKK